MDAAEATRFAATVVRALCGNRWTWPALRVTEEYPINLARRLSLTGRPVIEVFTVTDLTDDSEITNYRQLNNQYLTLPLILQPSGANCGPGRRVAVDYSYGSAPPLVAAEAIVALSAELTEDPDTEPCRIPERVTTVTRQGMSWTLIDPQDFLDDGRTGIYQVDLAIRTLNPAQSRARTRIFSAEYPPGERTASQVLS